MHVFGLYLHRRCLMAFLTVRYPLDSPPGPRLRSVPPKILAASSSTALPKTDFFPTAHSGLAVVVPLSGGCHRARVIAAALRMLFYVDGAPRTPVPPFVAVDTHNTILTWAAKRATEARDPRYSPTTCTATNPSTHYSLDNSCLSKTCQHHSITTNLSSTSTCSEHFVDPSMSVLEKCRIKGPDASSESLTANPMATLGQTAKGYEACIRSWCSVNLSTGECLNISGALHSLHRKICALSDNRPAAAVVFLPPSLVDVVLPGTPQTSATQTHSTVSTPPSRNSQVTEISSTGAAELSSGVGDANAPVGSAAVFPLRSSSLVTDLLVAASTIDPGQFANGRRPLLSAAVTTALRPVAPVSSTALDHEIEFAIQYLSPVCSPHCASSGGPDNSADVQPPQWLVSTRSTPSTWPEPRLSSSSGPAVLATPVDADAGGTVAEGSSLAWDEGDRATANVDPASDAFLLSTRGMKPEWFNESAALPLQFLDFNRGSKTNSEATEPANRQMQGSCNSGSPLPLPSLTGDASQLPVSKTTSSPASDGQSSLEDQCERSTAVFQRMAENATGVQHKGPAPALDVSFSNPVAAANLLASELQSRRSSNALFIGHFTESLRYAMDAVRRCPPSASAWLSLSTARRVQRQFWQAAAAVDIAVAADGFHGVEHGVSSVAARTNKLRLALRSALKKYTDPTVLASYLPGSMWVRLRRPTGLVVVGNPFPLGGCQVAYVVDGSSASRAGVSPGDQIIATDSSVLLAEPLNVCLDALTPEHKLFSKQAMTTGVSSTSLHMETSFDLQPRSKAGRERTTSEGPRVEMENAKAEGLEASSTVRVAQELPSLATCAGGVGSGCTFLTGVKGVSKSRSAGTASRKVSNSRPPPLRLLLYRGSLLDVYGAAALHPLAIRNLISPLCTSRRIPLTVDAFTHFLALDNEHTRNANANVRIPAKVEFD
eukprot:GHVT01099674.1.p1 GENE.GHVT01099674.1~~GHVT01099674.1.p1  ORF type:complete len:944 (+),score=110.81 GHVT01099674.1:484-3315(+)